MVRNPGTSSSPRPISLPGTQQQLEFSRELELARQEYLLGALLSTVEKMNLDELDEQLRQYVPEHRRRQLAARGLRPEMVYPVPSLLAFRPRLLTYYRLLYGFSRKQLYGDESTGMARFISMEEGRISADLVERLPEVCAAMILAAGTLVDGLGIDRLTSNLLDDLTLLTLGPSLRGAKSVEKGVSATLVVRRIIRETIGTSLRKETSKVIDLANAAGRDVIITFGSDPDITVCERLSPDLAGYLLAAEVKGGVDVSNIHNRLGEAEKSHLKARSKGYTEFWTIVNVSKLDPDMARRESPTTNQFFSLEQLTDSDSAEFRDFRARLASLLGITTKPPSSSPELPPVEPYC